MHDPQLPHPVPPRSPLVALVLIASAALLVGACTDSSRTEGTGDPSASAPTDTALDFNRNVRSTDPLSPEAERTNLRVPPGFEVQLFAAEPDITKPINLEFGPEGRLWVSQSQEYPFAAEEGEGSDQITILDPDRTVADQFRYRRVELQSGQVFNGLLQRREGDLLVFVDPAGRKRLVSEEEVANMTVSENSLMPDRFADAIPEEDFYDLLAYLRTLK